MSQHRYTGRSPLDIAVDNAAIYEKIANDVARELSEVRSPRYRQRHGYRPADEERLSKEIERYRKLAAEWVERAAKEEERGHEDTFHVAKPSRIARGLPLRRSR